MFCNKCGAQIADGSAVCPSCSAQFSAQQPQAFQQPAPQQTSGKLHCPQCKSHNISITTESSIDSAVTTMHGRRSQFGSTKFKNTHRNFWVCSDCGTKFRNIQSLEEEIAKTKNMPIVYSVFTVILLILSIVFITNISGGFFKILIAGPFTIASVIGTIVCFCLIFSSKSKLKKMREELAYLKQNCFN